MYNGYLGFDGTRNAGQPIFEFAHLKYEDKYTLPFSGQPYDMRYSSLDISRKDLSSIQEIFDREGDPMYEKITVQCKVADLPDTFLTYLKVKEDMNKINY